MYVKLNDRVYLNKDKITRIKVDSVQDGIRIRFYEGQNQVAKSGCFETEAKAIEWLEKNFINK
ncbi:sodium-dependent tyrosine transporter [Campylobacter concisus]|uniref:sodium-dependent tyrosine transporter n=1 Tax=Campylobacter concisus TaxID=199 RepID=UPI000D3121E7|nr:sodium-dependent tyrosine transporter [Campylobacter concisus]